MVKIQQIIRTDPFDFEATLNKVTTDRMLRKFLKSAFPTEKGTISMRLRKPKAQVIISSKNRIQIICDLRDKDRVSDLIHECLVHDSEVPFGLVVENTSLYFGSDISVLKDETWNDFAVVIKQGSVDANALCLYPASKTTNGDVFLVWEREMKAIPKTIDRDELLEKVSLRINQAIYRVNVGLAVTGGEAFVEEDLSSVTVQEILDKINDFLASNPLDEHYIVFLHYLANYPVSMCKRQVSPVLKLLMGFHYGMGQLLKEKYEKVSLVSMEEVAQLFGRSKATVHQYIKETEPLWKEFLQLLEEQKEIKKKAERELIEEEKERLRKEKATSEKDLDQKIQT